MCSWLYLYAHASLKTSNEAWGTITNQPEYSSQSVRAEIPPHSLMNTDTPRESKARGVGREGRFGGDHTNYCVFWEHHIVPLQKFSCGPALAAVGVGGVGTGTAALS